jgi:hypothetical protein
MVVDLVWLPSLPASDFAENSYPSSWPVSFCTSSAFSLGAYRIPPEPGLLIPSRNAHRLVGSEGWSGGFVCANVYVYKDERVPSRISLALIAIGCPAPGPAADSSACNRTQDQRFVERIPTTFSLAPSTNGLKILNKRINVMVPNLPEGLVQDAF